MYRKKNYQGEHIFEGKMRDFEKQIVDSFVKIGEFRYLTPKVSTIFAYLVIHGALTQSNLKDLTGYSLGTISNTLNLMMSINLVDKKLIPGTHTFIYHLFRGSSETMPQSSQYKLESVNEAKIFFQNKIKELEESKLKNCKGYIILLRRLREMMEFLNIWIKLLQIQKDMILQFKKE